MRRLLVLGMLALVGAGISAWPIVSELPSDRILRQVVSSCQVARLAGRDFALCPQALRYDEFPPHLADAIVASEDRRFFSHWGIDARSLAGAIRQNAVRSLREERLVVKRGGSTVTQQLARTLLLDERDGMSRKVAEAALALRIEWLFSKEQILAAYMNVAPHARGMNGFDAPARFFFGVKAASLDLAEAALLVAMLPAPNYRDPLTDPQEAYDGATRVLRRMAEQGKITPAAHSQAEAELKARVLGGKLRRGAETYVRLEYRPYRDLALAEAAQQDVAPGDEYRLITHMDPRLQAWTVHETETIAGPHQSAGVFMRPSGEVLAISGSRDYAENSYNRAFKASRSIGSTGKFFLMVAAFEAPAALRRVFPTDPLHDDWPNELSRKCRGKVNLMFAITLSCNRPFTWYAQELGPKLTEIVKRFELTPPGSPLLVPLGGIETSPLRLTRAFATVANDGNLPPVRSLVAVLERRGSVLLEPAESRPMRILTAETARAVRTALREPVRAGTAKAANSRHALVYGKTGTSSNNHDALFVGMTQDFVGAFWVGDDLPQSTGMFGGGAPAQAFARVTDAYYLSQAGPKGEKRPRPVLIEPRQVTPSVLLNGDQRALELALLLGLFLAGLYVRSFVKPRPRPRPVTLMARVEEARSFR